MTVAVDQTKTLIAGLPYVGSFAWANLPVPSSWSGYTALVSDFGVSPGILVVSDGTRWIPLGVQMLARSAVGVSVTGTLTETALATVAVPAGLLGVNGGLRVTAAWSHTNSANTKNLRHQFGSTSMVTAAPTTTASFINQLLLRNRNSAASQIIAPGNAAQGFGSTSGAVSLATENSANALNYVLTGQLTNVGETITLESYTVEVLP